MKKIPNKIRFSEIFASIQKALMIISSVFVTSIIVINVFLRYIMKKEFIGFEEIIVIAIMWMYFIGASYGSYEKSHISADMLSEKLKNKNAKNLHTILISTIDTAVLLVFCFWSAEYIVWNINHMMYSTTLRIPLITSQGSIFVGFLLMLLYNIYYLIIDVKNAFKF